MYFESATKLGLRQSALASALECEGFVQHTGGGAQQGLALLGSQRTERGERRQMGAVQNIVTPAAADTGHNVLIAEVGRETTPRSTSPDKFGELFASRFGPEPF